MQNSVPPAPALQPHCPNPECQGQITVRQLSMLADPSRHPLAPFAGPFPVVDRNLGFSLAMSVIGLVFAPLVVAWLGWWWMVPVYLILLFTVYTQGIYFLAAPSAGKLHLMTFRCRKCGYRWVRRVSPPETYLRKAEYELDRARSKGNKRTLAAFLSDVGGLRVMHRGDVASAIPLLEESLALRTDGRDRRGLAYSLNNLAFGLLYAGRAQEARNLAEQSLAIFRELKEWHGIASSANTLAETYIVLGEAERALPLLNQSLSLKWRMADEELIAWDLESMAEVSAWQRQWVRTARLLAAAQRLREKTAVARPPVAMQGVQRAINDAHMGLGETAFANAWAEGRHMTADQACDYALNARDVVPVTLPTYNFP